MENNSGTIFRRPVPVSFLADLDRLMGQPRQKTGRKERTFLLDVEERDGEYCITVELPGVSEEELEVVLDQKVLTIAVHPGDRSQTEGVRLLHRERVPFGGSRKISLPMASSSVEAELRDGLLMVVVRKEETARPKKIQIKRAE